MIIVNFATKEYAKGQERLLRSVTGKASAVMYSRYESINGPRHQNSPYEFKIHAIEAAWRQFPDDPIVLWVDASMYLVGDLSRMENIIKETGYFMEEAGHYVKDWCNPHARQYFNLTEEESHFIMFSAGLLGLDRTNETAMQFFTAWKASAAAGCFKGEWTNHRHDMTCASIIAQRMGLTYQKGGTHMAYIGPGYGQPQPGVVFYLQGVG